MARPSRRRRRRLLVTASVAVALVVGAAVAVLERPGPPVTPMCRAAAGQAGYLLDVEQAANATTIAAVGKARGLPDHAVTVALAAALQESKLRNLDYGDRDSLGLFQQRPSQGWGTRAQILDPRYAAAAFYRHLAQVPGWETLPLADAVQAVQRSAAPSAYAQWDGEARTLARVLTGEVPAGFTCRYDAPAPVAPGALDAAIAAELGAPALGQPLPTARGWTVASWLVGQAYRYRIASVTYAGQVWTPGSGQWRPGGPAAQQVTITRVR